MSPTPNDGVAVRIDPGLRRERWEHDQLPHVSELRHQAIHDRRATSTRSRCACAATSARGRRLRSSRSTATRTLDRSRPHHLHGLRASARRRAMAARRARTRSRSSSTTTSSAGNCDRNIYLDTISFRQVAWRPARRVAPTRGHAAPPRSRVRSCPGSCRVARRTAPTAPC